MFMSYSVTGRTRYRKANVITLRLTLKPPKAMGTKQSINAGAGSLNYPMSGATR